MLPLNFTNDFDLDYFFELSPDLVCIAGYDGYFKKINPSVSKTLGYTNEELFSKPIDSFIHPEDRDITSKKRKQIIRDTPLLNFENRYLTKNGETVWLIWTSIPVKSDEVIFAIAKNITYRKKLEEYLRISKILHLPADDYPSHQNNLLDTNNVQDLSPADLIWLNTLEALIRKNTGKMEVSIAMLSHELAISERQLNRRIKRITGITPNKYIRIIRLQIAREAIATGKYRTIAEISYLAGFETPAYFNKLFKEIFNINAGELLK